MDESYRSAQRRCPACAEVMTARVTKHAELDWCDGCGGVYVDWMDGPLRELAASSPGLSGAGRSGERAGALTAGASCPACSAGMHLEIGQDDAAVLRCPSCAGCFAPRAVWSSLGDDGDEPSQHASEPVLTRLLDGLARFFVGS